MIQRLGMVPRRYLQGLWARAIFLFNTLCVVLSSFLKTRAYSATGRNCGVSERVVDEVNADDNKDEDSVISISRERKSAKTACRINDIAKTWKRT
jgi:hypothetical protein